MTDVSYKLEDLARAAGTSPRTVRYYVQRGLLPGPAFRGRDTAYGHEHLVRLRAIKRLQQAFFPLDAIAAELARRSLDEIERIANGEEMPSRSPDATPAESVAPPAARWGVPGARSVHARALRSVELAPGVQLLVADDAPPESRRIAAEILRGQGIDDGCIGIG